MLSEIPTTWCGSVSSVHTRALHRSTERRGKRPPLWVIVLGIGVMMVLAGSRAPAQMNWVNVLSNSLVNYKTRRRAIPRGIGIPIRRRSR
jgi:hypothetical protein